MEYTVITKKTADGYYIATCPLLPEVIAQGKTHKKCLTNIKEVIELCLEYRKERGEDIPEEVGIDQVKVTV